jgi:hypothetical protein
MDGPPHPIDRGRPDLGQFDDRARLSPPERARAVAARRRRRPRHRGECRPRLEHGLIGAAAADAWRAVALVGFNELLVMIIRGTQETRATPLPRQSKQRHGCRMH